MVPLYMFEISPTKTILDTVTIDECVSALKHMLDKWWLGAHMIDPDEWKTPSSCDNSQHVHIYIYIIICIYIYIQLYLLYKKG